jgi:hypothetical protein
MGVVLADNCVYTATKCTCATNKGAGTCFHHISGPEASGLCTADFCDAGGFVCDCNGKSMCKINPCGSWKPSDLVAPIPPAGTTNVACTFTNGNKCLERIGDAPLTAREYKMVQLGTPKSPANMFNMTWQTDVDDFLTTTFADGAGTGVNNKWPSKETLKHRQINVRFYQGDSRPDTNKFVCAIINDWENDDGLGNYQVDSEIWSLTGDTIQFKQCDDWSPANAEAGSGECQGPLSATTLYAHHSGLVTNSDGWCAGPLRSGNVLSIKFSNLEKIEGINFQGSDGAVTEYKFAQSIAGLTGTVDSDGLVTRGAIPDIFISMDGIEVP